MDPVAIIGMECIFPGAPDVGSYWRNICQGVDAITEVPEHRWASAFFEPDSSEVDRFYCRRGGFVDEYAEFDPIEFGMMPNSVVGVEPDQLLGLRVAAGALRDAGYAGRDFPREKAAVILGRGNYAGAATLRLQSHVRTVQQILQTLRDLLPRTPDVELQRVRQHLKAQLDHYGPDVAAGVIPNLAASRLANRLDLRGPAYTVDAACASSLIAIEQACQALSRGECALALAGGVHLTHDLTFWATFCQLGALSRSQQIRPLARDADGILAGEGIGLVVLKRWQEAEADGDRIYAVLHGAGSASDGRSGSLLAPSVEGQLLSLRRAWQHTTLHPQQVGLLEAHGTGTPAGDAVELETVRRFFGEQTGADPRAVIGSVKSMIGHTMPAAGVAGLIKAALAVHHGVLPPTLHCDRPHELLEGTRFRAIGEQEPWPPGVRVAAVNAFGFGGINAHVILRSTESPAAVRRQRRVAALPPTVTVAADTKASLLEKLEHRLWDGSPQEGRWRLAILEPDETRVAFAHKVVRAGLPWHGQSQIYFSPDPLLAAGKLAFLFPGVDSSFEPRVADVAAHFQLPEPQFAGKADPADDLLRVCLGVAETDLLLFNALTALRIKADGMAGHSMGEWCAMAACNMLPLQCVHETMQQVRDQRLPDVDLLFLAAACDESQLREALADLPEIALSHDNCPHQVIVCGPRTQVAAALPRLRERRIFAQLLPFASGFHSPLFTPYMEPYREAFAARPLHEPAMPLWSATTGRPFPPGMAQKRALALEHLVRPVRFRQLIENLYADGFRAFVQVGTGSLVGFVDDTLKGRAHLAIGANLPRRSGMQQLLHVCAALWAEGAQFDRSLLSVEEPAPRATRRTALQRLSLGVPLIKLSSPPALSIGEPREEFPAGAGGDPLHAAFADVLADIRQAGHDVLALWRQRQQSAASVQLSDTPAPFDVRLKRHLDVATTIPLVRDHSFHREHEGWPVLADLRPVVPLTMEIELLREALQAQVPGHVVVGFDDVEAFRWLVVAEPVDITMSLVMREYPCVDVEIEGFLRGRAVLARHYPDPPVRAETPLRNPRACSISAPQLYSQNWMFHLEAYRGVSRLGPVGDDGIRGAIKVPPGPGSLLDNMGQLAGFWVMETQAYAPLAMPIGIERVRFYGPPPALGDELECDIRIERLEDRDCWSNQQLVDAGGRVCVEMLGWHTRRYLMTGDFFQRVREVELRLLGESLAPGIVLFEDRYETANMREYIALRVLNQPELREYEALPPRRRRQWLNGRVAAKDAVRSYLWEEQGRRPLFPKELAISNSSDGAPLVHPHISTPYTGRLHVSLSHKGFLAAAMAARHPVGIDIEVIEPRHESFLTTAFSVAELDLLSDLEPQEWYTRAWTAKEAVGKAMGTGLRGNPRSFRIDRVDGSRLRVNGNWVDTLRFQDYVIAYTGEPA